MSLTLRASALLGLGLLPLAGMAYDPKSHDEISQVVADRSVVASDPGTLQDLGLDPYANGQQFRNSRGTPNTIRELISNGAQFEDSDSRPAAHFYNPVTGLGILGFPASPDWAINGTGDADTIKFSFNAARQYLLNALTDPVQSFRSDRFGLTFQSLGQVIHHLQDMAQPQHVRSDLHCDSFACRFVPGLFNPSAYEYYTRDKDLVNGLLPTLPSYPAVYGAADTSTFASPRRFWNTEPPGPNSPVLGKGIAEFTNRNFISAGSNFDKPAQPSPPGFSLPGFDPSNNQFLTVGQLCTPAAQCPTSMTDKPDQRVVFYGTAGHDNYLGTDFVNPRASTESVFDQYLVAQGQSRIFSLNRFNFDAAHTFLLPRAVAYSTGLVNYFFRGKIDYVPDPDNPGGFLVKNLGTEPMKGKFQVYYDDTTGARHPVDGTLWDTEVILAGAATPGILGPGEGMPVPRIVAPQLPEPKTPNEYILVFTGEMGQERPENGSVGAVVGKLIQGTPYHGELYVAGLDAQNRIVTFKVDPSGLRVLNGFDANGQFHNTSTFWSSPTQRDIDPLFPVVNFFQQKFFFQSNVLTKVLRMKQPVFQTSVLGGMSHQMAAVSFPLSVNNFLSFVRDPTTGRLTLRDSVVRWTAHSPDPTIGDFEFRPESNGTYSFTRIFIPGPNQNPVTTGGSIVVPGDPVLVSLVNQAFQRGEVVASPDGLTVSGIKSQSQTDPSDPFSTAFWDTYELRLTLAAQPSATIVQTEHLQQTPLNVTSPNNVNESACTESGPSSNETDTCHSRTINDGERTDIDRKTFEDYIAGNLVTWRLQTHSDQTGEATHDATSHRVTSPPTGCPGTITTDVQRFDRVIARTINTFTTQLDQTITTVETFIPKSDGGSPPFKLNFTENFASHEVDTFICDNTGPTGPSPLTPGIPVIQDSIVFDSDAQDISPVVTGFGLLRSLNGKVDGSILFDQATRSFVLGGQPLPNTTALFIADSSPLGEIFAASTDKSTIIYKPAPSSKMPLTIDIPANITRLIAAVWL